MINAVHALINSKEPEKARAFMRDVLGLANVDAGGGWLIFKLPPAEIGVHPTDGEPSQEFYFMCDDIETTVKELTDKGVEFSGPVTEARFGKVTAIKIPGGGEIGIYEPLHPTAFDL